MGALEGECWGAEETGCGGDGLTQGRRLAEHCGRQEPGASLRVTRGGTFRARRRRAARWQRGTAGTREPGQYPRLGAGEGRGSWRSGAGVRGGASGGAGPLVDEGRGQEVGRGRGLRNGAEPRALGCRERAEQAVAARRDTRGRAGEGVAGWACTGGSAGSAAGPGRAIQSLAGGAPQASPRPAPRAVHLPRLRGPPASPEGRKLARLGAGAVRLPGLLPGGAPVPRAGPAGVGDVSLSPEHRSEAAEVSAACAVLMFSGQQQRWAESMKGRPQNLTKLFPPRQERKGPRRPGSRLESPARALAEQAGQTHRQQRGGRPDQSLSPGSRPPLGADPLS